MKTRKVVVVGGGFAGLKAARRLCRRSDVHVTLIDRRNYHLFQPLLYQVATAGLSPAEIACPIRSVFSGSENVDIVLAEVTDIDVGGRLVRTFERDYSYDYLILACGAEHSYFSHPEWEEWSPGLKTLEQATEIRRRILLAFEKAETENDVEEQQALLTFVIVGGGPTGVELAGAIAEIGRFTLEKDFRHIRPESARVLLVEAGDRLLSAFPESLSHRAAADLRQLGVDIQLSARVTNVNERGVSIGESWIESRTVIWAAGVKPSPLSAALGVPLDNLGRVQIQHDLSVPDHPEIFVLGDQANFPTADGRGLPGLAPVAMQQGDHAAKNIIASLDGRERAPFRYVDKGIMATIGRKKAVAAFAGFKVTGLLAWWMWLFVHIYFLIGFKNRLFVFIDWTWSYLTFSRGARLIVGKEWRSPPSAE